MRLLLGVVLVVVVAITASQAFISDARAAIAYSNLEVAGHGGEAVPSHDDPDCCAVSCPLTILSRPQQTSFTKPTLSSKIYLDEDTVFRDRVPDRDPPVPRGGQHII